MFLFAQCLVAIATLLDLASFQFKSRSLILMCLFSSVLLTSVHFFILGHASAGSLMLIAAIRYLYCVFARKTWVMLAFMLLSCLAVYFTWYSWLSGLALAATLIQTFASFQKNDLYLRLIMVVGTSLWISHNILVGSPIAVLMESLFMASNLVGLYRFYTPKKLA
ncbi:YgjV family protein [Pseudoalteromonas sp. SWN29]|uniref:YgjV family protein n=1 Tax=Pseudoalteromonas sp. SWN29 TaxID=2792064 RepID=UPI0018CF1368|nr:YgjV family protein [Pseudoalteromonas sp. SWN29]MBH0026421.1 YgjV family protein [Pseudoalteromonas sp. SWN29]